MMDFNYTRKDLIKLIKAKNKKDYKFLLDEAIGMILVLNGVFQKQKNYDFDEGVADFVSCSVTNECDDLLKHKKELRKK